MRRGQGHRTWAPEGNPGDERRAYRSDPLPRQLPTRLHDRYLESDDRRPAGLARLELRWPVATDRLPSPCWPRRPGVPNLADAAGAVAVLVEQVNATVGPVLAELEARR